MNIILHSKLDNCRRLCAKQHLCKIYDYLLLKKVDQRDSAAMLSIMRPAGIKARKGGIHPTFETKGKHHQKLKTRESMVHKKDLCPQKKSRTRKSYCVNARGIPPTAYQVLHTPPPFLTWPGEYLPWLGGGYLCWPGG